MSHWKIFVRSKHCTTTSQFYQPSNYFYIDIHVWNGYEYLVVNDGKTWPDAERYCVERGGHLASITSQAENEFLTQIGFANYNDG